MKIYKVYKFYDGNCDDPYAVYVSNYDKAIQILNDLVRGECKNVAYGKLNEEEFREALKKFRKWSIKWVDVFICRKYPFIMYKDIFGNLVVDIPYKEEKTCGCEGYNLKVNRLILREIEVVE